MNLSIRPCNLSFKANIPLTEGYYRANMAADKMLNSGNTEEVNLANAYKQSLQILKQDKYIDEIEVVRYYPNVEDSMLPRCYPTRTQGVWIDKTLVYRGEDDVIPESFTSLDSNSYDDQTSYKTMKGMISIADNIDTITKLKYRNGRCDYYGIGSAILNKCKDDAGFMMHTR